MQLEFCYQKLNLGGSLTKILVFRLKGHSYLTVIVSLLMFDSLSLLGEHA